MNRHADHELVELGVPLSTKPTQFDAPLNGDQTDSLKSRPDNRHHHDADTLARLGKRQVLKRRFGFMSMLSFNCTVLVTWEGVLVLFVAGFTNGGPAGLVYGFIVIWIGTTSIFLTIAELASLAPTAGGQYHWVFMLAPKSAKKFLSYTTGWLTVLAWQSLVASGGYLTGTMIQGLLVLNYPNYVPQQWHGTLLYGATILVSVFVNTVVSNLLPQIEGLIFGLHILGFLAILIVLTYMAPHGPASEVFTLFLNQGDWDTQGLSFLIGLIGISFSFVVNLTGADAAVHMSEEIENPSLTVPRSIITSITINGSLGFAILLATLFGLGNIDAVLKSPTGYPYMEIFLQATGSVAGTTTMVAIVIALSFGGTIGSVATSSRMIWSFARDRGLPFSSFLSKVEPRSSNPLFAVTVTTVFACLLSLINLGSSTVLNDVLSLSIAGFYATYFVAASLLLYNRCKGTIKSPTAGNRSASAVNSRSGEFNLVWGPWRIPGILGIINNVFACAYMIIVWFFSFWPPTDPTTPSTMNYASLVAGSIVLFSVFYYFVWGKNHYSGPIVEIRSSR